MANSFKSGTVTVPTGVSDFSVTGLSLSFEPRSAIVSIRQPSASADFLSAYITGSITTDGFSVTLSAPASVSGYLLDYTLFSEGGVTPSVDGDSLAVTYSDLKKSVARFLGYDETALTTRQTDEVDEIIQSGVRRYYYPPAMDGVDPNFEWSFLRYDGSVSTTADVNNYRLPNGFGRVMGQIAVADDQEPMVPIIPYADIVKMQARNPQTGRPRFAAVIFEKNIGTKGQTKKMYLYPTPDKVYSLSFKCDSDQGKIDATNNPFPLGCSMYAELITESCLAVAEQRANDEIGLHTQNFNTLLVSMIQRDRKVGAQNFGRFSQERMW